MRNIINIPAKGHFWYTWFYKERVIIVQLPKNRLQRQTWVISYEYKLWDALFQNVISIWLLKEHSKIFS